MATISKKARYVIHGLAFVAARSDGRPVPFDAILAYLQVCSKSLALSAGYIAKVFQDVARSDFLKAVTGPRGGYQLIRSPEKLTIAEIVEAVDGPLISEGCLLSIRGCGWEDHCGVRSLIGEADRASYRVLAGETLAGLVGRMTFPEPAEIEARRRGAAAVGGGTG